MQSQARSLGVCACDPDLYLFTQTPLDPYLVSGAGQVMTAADTNRPTILRLENRLIALRAWIHSIVDGRTRRLSEKFVISDLMRLRED